MGGAGRRLNVSTAPARAEERAIQRPAGPLDGRASLLLAAVVGALLLVSPLSPAIFAVALLGACLLAAYAAHRWPMATLLGGALVTLLDVEALRRVMPAGVDIGPLGIGEPLLAIAGVVILVDGLRRGTVGAAVRDPVVALAVLFVGVAVLSAAVNGTPPGAALLGIAMTVDAIAIYVAVRIVRPSIGQGAAVVAGFVAAAVLIAAFGIAQYLLDPDLLGFQSVRGQFGEGTRITSFIGHPNMVAAVIGVALPFPLFAAARLEDRTHRWLARAAVLIMMLALVLTFSRGAWLAVALAGGLGALLFDRRALALLLAAVVLAVGATMVLPRNVLTPRAAGPPPLFDSTADRLGNVTQADDVRAHFLRDGLRIVNDHPLLGVGPGRYGGAAATIIPSPVYEEYDTSLFGYRTVHNFWLHLLGEVGALGTAVFLTMVIGLGIRLGRGARRESGLAAIILAGSATSLGVAIINSATEMIFEGNMPVLLLWLVLGVASTLVPSQPLLFRSGAALEAADARA